MVSSRVMASSSSANSDLIRQSASVYPLSTADPSKNHGSIMEDLMRNMYGENPAAGVSSYCGESDGGEEAPAMSRITGNKSVDDVWKEISGGGGGRKVDLGVGSAFDSELTLEEFLSKEEARVLEEFAVDPVMSAQFGQQHQHQDPLSMENPLLGFGNGAESGGGGGGGERGKGRKRPVLDPVDKSLLQRQKRMIKNRESAARSRERKQAYTLELEALVTRLEGENAEVLGEMEEMRKKRLKQLLENLIPVTERKRPRPGEKEKSSSAAVGRLKTPRCSRGLVLEKAKSI